MIITIVNQKGGTGKTTTAMNLAVSLSKSDNKVLLVDWDPQSNLSFSFGVTSFKHSVSDVITEDCSLSEAIIEQEGIDILPADYSLADIELSLTNLEDREMVLKELLREQALEYDFIIIDCLPALSLLTINALVACDKIIIPLQLTVLSMQGLDQVINLIERVKKLWNPSLKILGVLPVLFDSRLKVCKEVLDFMSENFDLHVFNNFIRRNVKVIEAPSHGVSLMSYAPNSIAAKDYNAFKEELVEML